MSVLIVGSEGSMGKRYQAILKYLNRKFICVDKQNTLNEVSTAAQKSQGIIIATPTHTHGDLIRQFAMLGKPILCEKPITKDPQELKDIITDLKTWGSPFRMMMQYEMLIDRSTIGPSHYDYFKHGSDGLIWDCMQIIALARAKLELREESPVWSCKINGKTLSLAHMDAAYIGYVQKWFQSPRQDLGYIESVHQKVLDAEKKAKNVH
jgi:hypothetical protein